jgi:hypothetical protein
VKTYFRGRFRGRFSRTFFRAITHRGDYGDDVRCFTVWKKKRREEKRKGVEGKRKMRRKKKKDGQFIFDPSQL